MNSTYPLAAFNKRANIRSVFSPLNTAWRERATGEMFAEVYRANGTVRVTLFDEQQRADGIGTDTRSAYRAAWRAQRLARHDTAALRRQVATLQRQLGHDLGQALAQLNRRIDELSSQKQAHRSEDAHTRRRARHAAAIRAHRAALQRANAQCSDAWQLQLQVSELKRRVSVYERGMILDSERMSELYDECKRLRQQRTRRRARYAAAIRAHRAALAAQRQQYEESLRTCRRHLLERTKERGDLALGLAAIRREIVAARETNRHVADLVPDVTDGGLLEAVRILLKLAAGYAEMHRRATAAEARAEQAMAGQRSLIAAARAAGLEYVLSDTVRFVPTRPGPETDARGLIPQVVQQTAPTDGPTGGETPTDSAQPADAQRLA